jgi:hypothetical protein
MVIVGAVVSFVNVTGDPVLEFSALSSAAIACAPGELVDPAIHEYVEDGYVGPVVTVLAECVQPAVVTAG